MAKKQNDSAAEMDLTAWDWAGETTEYSPPCASCHPGGGPMELDRDGNRYDDYLATNPGLRDEYDGDYYQSNWDKSGVLEADCLLCHSTTYDWDARTAQLTARNYKWAATVGAVLGTATGQVTNGQTPVVTYNTRLFNADGTVSLDIRLKPPDDNCLACHASPDLRKRGFSWFDPANPDVHNLQGITCVDCHPASLDHQIAKGNSSMETVRDDLDNTMRTCRDCHQTGYMGATVPQHLNVPPSHIEKLACETCHIPYKQRTPSAFFDLTHGMPNWDVLGEGYGAGVNKKWLPVYERREDLGGTIVPVNTLFAAWWANRDKDGRTWPLFAREIRAAWDRVSSDIRDDNGDWYAEVNTRPEIELMLTTLGETLQGGRFDHVHPVYIKGQQAWEFDDSGELTSYAEAGLCASESFSISHNVAPVSESLGATGCSDCHSTKSTFFARPVILDPYNIQGEPVTKLLGISGAVAGLFGIHFAVVRPWVWLLAIASLFAIVLHFIGFGPHEFEGDAIEHRDDDREALLRFTWKERTMHLTVLLTFGFLALTGFAFAVSGGGQWLNLFFHSLVVPRKLHGYLGLVFGVGLLAMALLWWRDSLFRNEDREWFRKLGGYLGNMHRPLSAGRFNAGQKAYFWTVLAGGLITGVSGIVLFFKADLSINAVMVALIVHDLGAFLGIAVVLAHFYLSTLANPGTVHSIFVGRVTKLWARLNHPLWYEKLTGRPALDTDVPGKDD